MQLYLIRHGQSYVNLHNWQNGNTDEGLTALGQAQAHRLAEWLPQHLLQIDVLYASTMRRAQETAAILASAYGMEYTFDDRLREMGNNRLDYSPWPSQELPRTYADYWGSARPFSPIVVDVEGGESYMHFRTRVGILIEELVRAHPRQTVALVCHGGVVEAAFDHIFNIGPWRHCEVWHYNTAITHFEYVAHPDREAWRLHYHNRVEHLAGLEYADDANSPADAGDA